MCGKRQRSPGRKVDKNGSEKVGTRKYPTKTVD